MGIKSLFSWKSVENPTLFSNQKNGNFSLTNHFHAIMTLWWFESAKSVGDLGRFQIFYKSFTRPQFACKVGRMHIVETSHIKEKRSQLHWQWLFFTLSTELKRIWFHQIKSVIGNDKSQIFLLWWLGLSPLLIKSLLRLGMYDCQIGVDTHLC